MIELREVRKAYAGRPAVDGLSLTVARGDLLVLIGASGSGKSTALRLINRLLDPDSGQILLEGRDLRDYQPEQLRRQIGYAIQSTGLFPHWTVARNIATVPQLLGWPAGRIASRVDELLNLFGLAPADYRGRYPHQLSGGQQQRVGVARALAADPPLVLMDEPFAAVDPLRRLALQDELKQIHRTTGKTIVLVTHDIEEALRLATRIVLLDNGRIVQDGTPADLLEHPADAAVGNFIAGQDLGPKLLGLATVADHLRPGDDAAGPAVASSLSLREALTIFVARRVDRIPVVDADGRPLGTLHFSDLLRQRP